MKIRQHSNTAIEYVKKNYQEIPGDEIKHDYCTDWYDGPLSGIAFWQNKRYFFLLLDTEDVLEPVFDCDICQGTGIYTDTRLKPQDCLECQKRINYYGLYELKPKVLEAEDFWNDLFKLCIRNDKLANTDPEAKAFMWKFYCGRKKKDYKEIDFTTDCRPIGWFKD